MKNFTGLAWDVIGVAGFASLCYGAWQISPPWAWITGGALALAAAYKASG